MFTDQTLGFLRDLQHNNSRAWFTENRDRYETAVKGPAEAVAARISADLGEATGLEHRAKVFRIHRDLRFSKDPTPYNTHIHLSFTPQTGQPAPPAWMLGLSPAYFTLGCGIMAFDKSGLATFRERVAGPDGAAVAEVLERLAGEGMRLSDPELKRVPAPWPQDHPHAALLRRKGLVAWIDGESATAGIGPKMPERALSDFGRLRPLFDLLRPN